ncbi:MAG: ABC transporter ATP-binding protein [Mycoplasmataceae bacterium]|jgi:putative ABC transport system ATP-binding protein|nr:ABC transporter ATP-binding protein [Mycoplasmataceae bacterium]
MDTKQLITNNRALVSKLNVNSFNQIVKQAKKNKDTSAFISFIENIQTSLNAKEPFASSSCLRKMVSSFKRQEKMQKLLLSGIIKDKTKQQKLKKALDAEKQYFKILPIDCTNKFISKCVKQLEKIQINEIKNPDPSDVVYLENVTKYYYNNSISTRVLDNVSLKIKEGTFVVILGPSGSGKTTLLNLISGMDIPSCGQVIVCNENLTNMSSSKLTDFRCRNISYVFQQYGLLPNLTVKENVEIGANLQKNPNFKLDIDEVLKSVGLEENKKKMPYQLSGGQQQRAAIARSIAKNPKILFGDEPTGAVDQKNSDNIIKLFKDINKKYKTTVIIVTHNPDIAKIADMVINVNDGKLNISYNTPSSK